MRKNRKTQGEFRITKWEFDNPTPDHWKPVVVPVYLIQKKDEKPYKAIVPMKDDLKGWDAKDNRKTLIMTADTLQELEGDVEAIKSLDETNISFMYEG